MNLCDLHAHAVRLQTRHDRLRRLGWTTPAMRAYDLEQEWKTAGELAIRLEMERRLAIRFPPPVLLPHAS